VELRHSSGSFLKKKATLHALRYWNNVKMMMGINQSMFVLLSEGAAGV
jgi:hypothetical protein